MSFHQVSWYVWFYLFSMQNAIRLPFSAEPQKPPFLPVFAFQCFCASCRQIPPSLSLYNGGLQNPSPYILSLVASTLRSSRLTLSSPHNSPSLCFSPSISSPQGLRALQNRVLSKSYALIEGASLSIESIDSPEEIELLESPTQDNLEHLLTHKDDVVRLMKMERRRIDTDLRTGRWFPYLDRFKCEEACLSSGEVVEALEPHIMESRMERFRNVATNRSYSVCLVVEGLSDFGNVSAAFRSADALGFQSVHIVSCDGSKRYRENRHVSKGAEKWLDIEAWDSIEDCFKALKSRGYRITTTHVGMDVVSIYEMDWSCPTAIVVGNENSDEALGLSDLHCGTPMKGMVDSFNVSVAAGILMHHAVCDRISRLGSHGDLTVEERQILLAEFSLRHGKSSISIAHEFAKRKAALPTPKL